MAGCIARASACARIRKNTWSDRGYHRMRTTAQRSPAAGAGETVAGRRGRAAGKAEPAVSGPEQPSPPESPSVAVTTVRMLRVDEGLYALRIGAIAGDPSEIAGMVVPVAHIDRKSV